MLKMVIHYCSALQDGVKAVQTDQKVVEACFVFACVWAFGGCLAVEKTADHCALFSKYWVQEWKTVLFPDQVSTQQVPITENFLLTHDVNLPIIRLAAC